MNNFDSAFLTHLFIPTGLLGQSAARVVHLQVCLCDVLVSLGVLKVLLDVLGGVLEVTEVGVLASGSDVRQEETWLFDQRRYFVAA